MGPYGRRSVGKEPDSYRCPMALMQGCRPGALQGLLEIEDTRRPRVLRYG